MMRRRPLDLDKLIKKSQNNQFYSFLDNLKERRSRSRLSKNSIVLLIILSLSLSSLFALPFSLPAEAATKELTFKVATDTNGCSVLNGIVSTIYVYPQTACTSTPSGSETRFTKGDWHTGLYLGNTSSVTADIALGSNEITLKLTNTSTSTSNTIDISSLLSSTDLKDIIGYESENQQTWNNTANKWEDSATASTSATLSDGSTSVQINATSVVTKVELSGNWTFAQTGTGSSDKYVSKVTWNQTDGRDDTLVIDVDLVLATTLKYNRSDATPSWEIESSFIPQTISSSDKDNLTVRLATGRTLDLNKTSGLSFGSAIDGKTVSVLVDGSIVNSPAADGTPDSTGGVLQLGDDTNTYGVSLSIRLGGSVKVPKVQLGGTTNDLKANHLLTVQNGGELLVSDAGISTDKATGYCGDTGVYCNQIEVNLSGSLTVTGGGIELGAYDRLVNHGTISFESDSSLTSYVEGEVLLTTGKIDSKGAGSHEIEIKEEGELIVSGASQIEVDLVVTGKSDTKPALVTVEKTAVLSFSDSNLTLSDFSIMENLGTVEFITADPDLTGEAQVRLTQATIGNNFARLKNSGYLSFYSTNLVLEGDGDSSNTGDLTADSRLENLEGGCIEINNATLINEADIQNNDTISLKSSTFENKNGIISTSNANNLLALEKSIYFSGDDVNETAISGGVLNIEVSGNTEEQSPLQGVIGDKTKLEQTSANVNIGIEENTSVFNFEAYGNVEIENQGTISVDPIDPSPSDTIIYGSLQNLASGAIIGGMVMSGVSGGSIGNHTTSLSEFSGPYISGKVEAATLHYGFFASDPLGVASDANQLYYGSLKLDNTNTGATWGYLVDQLSSDLEETVSRTKKTVLNYNLSQLSDADIQTKYGSAALISPAKVASASTIVFSLDSEDNPDYTVFDNNLLVLLIANSALSDWQVSLRFSNLRVSYFDRTYLDGTNIFYLDSTDLDYTLSIDYDFLSQLTFEKVSTEYATISSIVNVSYLVSTSATSYNSSSIRLSSSDLNDTQIFKFDPTGDTDNSYYLRNSTDEDYVILNDGFTNVATARLSELTDVNLDFAKWGLVSFKLTTGEVVNAFVSKVSGSSGLPFALTLSSSTPSSSTSITIEELEFNYTQLFRINEAQFEETTRYEIDRAADENSLVLADNTVYTIVSSIDSQKVVNLDSLSSKNHANIQLYDMNGTYAQQFLVTKVQANNGSANYFTLTNILTGKVLDVAGAQTADGTNVAQYSLNGTYAQLWYATQNSDGTVTFHSALDDNLVLDVAGAQTENGTNIYIYTKNDTNAQKFNLITQVNYRTDLDVQAQSSYLAQGYYQIQYAANSNYAFSSESTATSTNVSLARSSDTTTQVWYIQAGSNGYYQIQNASSGSYLAVDVLGEVANESNIYTTEEISNASSWFFVQDSQGYYQIRSGLIDQMTVDLSGNLVESGRNIHLYENNSTEAQVWTLVPYDDKVEELAAKVSESVSITKAKAHTIGGTYLTFNKSNKEFSATTVEALANSEIQLSTDSSLRTTISYTDSSATTYYLANLNGKVSVTTDPGSANAKWILLEENGYYFCYSANGASTNQVLAVSGNSLVISTKTEAKTTNSGWYFEEAVEGEG